ncbi:DUF4082 domain-containing protein [Ornithinimicrobium pekingense]|uniref:DUF4082 domain-containing protein n=1 Tax=Ornithinimicrobium pekingense TaxID=384677 RepID=UPI00146A2305|nr:DUF4082 domain-containing protein [Ornithinimicrobium pekingense]
MAAATTWAPPALAATSGGAIPDDLRPRVAVDPDRDSVELGVRFTAEAAGTITALQYYQGRGAQDVSTARLWNAKGEVVAYRYFRPSTREGWRTLPLREPVSVKAGETFVASYHAPRGGYPATNDYFTRTTTTNGLKVSPGAGVYKYGRSGLPTRSYQNSNYLVDVVYTPSATTAPAPAPEPEPEPTPEPPAPEPSPTSDLRGWELNASNTGLAPHGLSCASLPRYTGSLTPRAGTRISGVRIEGILDLSAGDIVITKSCIRPPTGDNRNLVFNDNWRTGGGNVTSASTVTITDSEFDGSAAPASQIGKSCAFRGVGTLERNYIHGMGSGICFFGTGSKHDAVAKHNYVTGLRAYGDSHNEAATIRDFAKNSTDTRRAEFIDNRFDCRTGNDTGGLFIQPTFASLHNVFISGNYMEGAGYNLYLENSPRAVYTNVNATNNRFRPTSWGAVAVASGERFRTWSDNHIYDANAADGKGRLLSRP